jgi:chromate reductase, NAD(P)H dehydrogenase (quinone)
LHTAIRTTTCKENALTIKIVGLSGSLRKDSLNTRLLRAAANALPENAELIVQSIADIPLYNYDDETSSGIPPAVTAVKDAIAAADGLLISTPEYNNSIPGVIKNTIDWLSRPANDVPRVFGGRPTALMGASPGAYGTLLSQNAWLPVMRALGTNLWNGGRLIAPRANQLFAENGTLEDEAMQQRLTKFLAGFVSYIRQQQAST